MCSDINKGSFTLRIHFTSIQISETVVIHYSIAKVPYVLYIVS